MFSCSDVLGITGGAFFSGLTGEGTGSAPSFLVPVLVIILAVVLVVLLAVTILYKNQQSRIRRQEQANREVARRRRIRPSVKNEVFERDNYTCQICGISRDYLDSFCEGLGDYLLLEADHIRSVSQGGTGRDIDNLQCLCWRCNRKKGGNKTNEQVRDMIDYGIGYLNDDSEW
jgi:5-methylcytosine-specific restriction endonuclease McrA